MRKISVFLICCLTFVASIAVADETPTSYRGCYVLHTDGTRTLLNLGNMWGAGFNPDDGALEFRVWEDGYLADPDDPESYVEGRNVILLKVCADEFAGVEFTQDFDSAVEGIQQPQLRLEPTRTALYIYGAEPGTQVAVYTVSGQKLFSRVINGDDVVNMQGYTPGIYLISINGHTYKYFLQ